ncbi:sulfurtransferase [Devosia riboflavina]|uniref:Sulfurtransferase n=1 Tax=Devosia riboflavina TaxID=46914 RepID=A0A087LYJ1_9HYPH|nr:sulfurtransferase/chromate resistance protein [Devosia riboflavina]KFL29694.1 sulfurtransferase [Devosia riboflavina]
MAPFASISIDKLARLVGTPQSPVIIDVRDDEMRAAEPHVLPGSLGRPWQEAGQWLPEIKGSAFVVTCAAGGAKSEGVAALLRAAGHQAEILEGGITAWREAPLPTIPLAKLPPASPSLWVTRVRPKIDRIACPWLIRRFVDPLARFLFVSASEVSAVAERFDAIAFDIEGVHWSHRGELCTFDVMIGEFGLTFPALQKLATIVRGADTARLDLAPEVAGLLAVSLGLSRMYADDLEQLDAGMLVYDALYRWCRDAGDETHNWPGTGARK